MAPVLSARRATALERAIQVAGDAATLTAYLVAVSHLDVFAWMRESVAEGRGDVMLPIQPDRLPSYIERWQAVAPMLKPTWLRPPIGQVEPIPDDWTATWWIGANARALHAVREDIRAAGLGWPEFRGWLALRVSDPDRVLRSVQENPPPAPTPIRTAESFR
jgi:hypothetical protein